MKRRMTLLAAIAACWLSGLAAAASHAQQAAAGGPSGQLPADVRAQLAPLSSAKAEERAAAACALGRMGERAAPAIPHLVALLGDGAPVAATAGCGTEEPFEDEAWAPDYEGVLEPSPGEAATHALIAIGDASLSTLRDVLARGSHWRARKNAAWAFAHRGSAADALVSALRRDDAWQVRAQAAYALFQRGGDSRTVVEALIAATRDAAWQVRAEAAAALGHKGAGEVDVVMPLVAALTDQSARVRAQAAFGLFHTADARAFEPLMHALKDEDETVRKNAAFVLGSRAGDREVQLLIAARNSSDRRVRDGARRALAVVKDRLRGTETSLRPVNIPE